jgi:hypothetical protein
MFRNFSLLAIGFLAVSLSASADSVTLSLDPSGGTVSGVPGDTVGWGYTLDNNTGDYLLVSYSAFCEAGEDLLFTGCSPNLGASTYTDFTSSNFILIDPGGSAIASFDPTTLSGVGEYSIDPTITSGTDSGNIMVVYDLYDADPTVGPANEVCQSAFVCDWEVSAAAEVVVTSGTSTVPEPRLALLLCFGLAALIACRAGAKLRNA